MVSWMIVKEESKKLSIPLKVSFFIDSYKRIFFVYLILNFENNKIKYFQL
ncbi:hypothetical protein P872_16595 [Rhodonellum psychrophilum GCM71 = DSM 17998]|uniref:Uncharacterized protein n=1 Tax=Rhodonellum psychrophilum GCM71 = DSM 17998 TaxID=1123057 RepID=U5C517_9BACT|nr:hypothetical protein P872_16595 [Rhodonellum psychrophilum GCM71 = DSM 17998]